MLNIIVINCDDRHIRYSWDSLKDFIKDMESDNENIPMLDDALAEVNTDNEKLKSFYPSVNDLVEKCKNLCGEYIYKVDEKIYYGYAK